MFMCKSNHNEIDGCIEVRFKGFFIRKFKESEIRDYFLNEELRMAGKSHSIAIDRYQEKFFIPIDSVASSKELDSLLSRNLNFYDTQPFAIPSTLTSVAIRKFCDQNVVRDSLLNKYELDNFFCTSSQNSRGKFLYKIALIEGVAIKTHLVNTNENRAYVGSKYRIKSTIDTFDAYFIKQITSMQENYKSDSLIREWSN